MKKDIFLYRFDIEVGIFIFLYLKKAYEKKANELVYLGIRASLDFSS